MTDKAIMQPTPEQRDAIHLTGENLALVAGAGSGKTRVLVERYLQLLADNPGWQLKSLVAITFTRAAAFEMRHRVRLALEQRAEASGDALWLRHLSQMDTARIDTIHGLCADILRANAAEAGIDPQFEILEETDAAILLENVVEDTLIDLNPDLMALFAAYDSDRILSELLRADLINAELPTEPPDSQALLDRWRREQEAYALSSRDALLMHDDIRLLLEAAYDAPPGDKLGALFDHYCAALRHIAIETDGERLRQLLDECYKGGAVGNLGSAAAWGGKAAKRAAGDILRRAREALKAQLDRIGEPLGELDAWTAQAIPLWTRLLLDIQSAYRRRKMSAALLDFDDLERLAARVLAHPAVRQRYRQGEINCLLVDEFQDTNQPQWRIAQSLAAMNRGGSLFVVGDPKQSVYQFRGADVSVFNRVRAEIGSHANGRELRLSTSFRAHRRLVSHFNALFARLLMRDPASPAAAYEVEFEAPMHAFRDESPAEPSVECLLLDLHDKDEQGNYLTQPGSKRRVQIPAYVMRRWEALEIGWRVQRVIREQRQIHDGDAGGWRPVDYGDIAILFQSMSHISIYEDRFKALGIPFVTIAGRGYFDRQEVWDMLDLLRCLHNPADDLSLASALRSPMFGFSDDWLLALRDIPAGDDENQPLGLWQALQRAGDGDCASIDADDLPTLVFARDTLRDLRRRSGRVAISRLLRDALDATGYLAMLTRLPDGARRRGNIEKLLQLADDGGHTSLGQFSRYLTDLSAREVREGEALIEAGAALRLMTAHASKGLEFPMVILADASWAFSGGSASTLLDDREHGFSCQVFDADAYKYASGFAHRRNLESLKAREAAERKRLLYVAATRAKDFLLVSGQCRRNAKGQWTARGWLDQLLDAWELRDIEPEPEQRVAFADDEIRVFMPPLPPKPERLFGVDDSAAQPLPPASDAPLTHPAPQLIDPAPVPPPAVNHVAATTLADLGFSGAPALTAADEPSDIAIDPRRLGLVMHELLRDDLTDASDDMIRALAWRQDISESRALEMLLAAVRDMLQRYRRSDVHGWIAAARAAGRQCITEMPFIYRRDGRVIHGVIDLVIQREDGGWTLVDYKTTSFKGDTAPYAPQLAIYAAALRDHLGLPRLPAACLHFLLDGITVPVSHIDCERALESLTLPDARDNSHD